MFYFFHSLAGSKSSPKGSDKALLREGACLLQEQDTIPLMMDCQGEGGRKEPRLPTTAPYTFSVALPQHNPSGLGMGNMGPDPHPQRGPEGHGPGCKGEVSLAQRKPGGTGQHI